MRVKERCQKIEKDKDVIQKLQMKHSFACTCVRMLRDAQYSKIRASAQHDKENEFKRVEESIKKINERETHRTDDGGDGGDGDDDDERLKKASGTVMAIGLW